MASIRINIIKQLGRDGLVPVIAYPAEAAYDFRSHNCIDDMRNLSTQSAYEMRIYPDGKNVQFSLIQGIDGGYLQYAVLMDISRSTIEGSHLLSSLSALASCYESLASNDAKPSANTAFQKAIAAIHRELADHATPGYPKVLPVSSAGDKQHLTFYMNYKTEGEISTLLKFPDQEFFNQTSSLYLIPDHVHPATPQACKHIHSLVRRTFKIKAPDGYEYGQVKEGETQRIHLKGKEGMLPMTADVVGDVTKPSPYGYFDTATNTIRIDERTIKFYYELNFIVKSNGRVLRSCIVRYNGEQVIPDPNGNYPIKVYEDQVQDAGYIHFTGENFKDADIQVTPGIVRQLEYVYTPDPKHDVTKVTLDFSDGNPIKTHIDVGTNDRLFHQLRDGKVKGYRVKQEGEEFTMYIPRKMSKSSSNILRFLKSAFLAALVLGAYAITTYVFTSHWPWPIEREAKATVTKARVDKMGEVTEVTEEEIDDSMLIVKEGDQVSLSAADATYLNSNNVWRKDSLKSNKYIDVVNTIFNGSISEIRLKNINSKVINNSWWDQIWRNFIVPNNIHPDEVRKAFSAAMTADQNTLDLVRLFEELNKHQLPSDGVKPQPQAGVTNAPSGTGY